MARVQTIINQLMELKPDDEIIIAYWAKELVDEWIKDDFKPLSEEKWQEVVDEVGLENSYFENVGEWIQHSAMDKADPIEEESEE